MKTAMTDRDKKLLYFLGIVVIVALFWLIGIRPATDSIKKTEKKIVKAEETHDLIKTKKMRLGVAEAFVERLSADVKEYGSRYYPIMDSAQIDEMLTSDVLKRGLRSKNLYIKMPEESLDLEPYAYSSAAGIKEEREGNITYTETESDPTISDIVGLTDGSEKTKKKTASESTGTGFDAETAMYSDDIAAVEEMSEMVADTTGAGVYAVDISMTVTGSMDRLQAWINSITENKSILIKNYSFTEAVRDIVFDENGDPVITEQQDYELSVNMFIFMYDDSNYEYILDRYIETEE